MPKRIPKADQYRINIYLEHGGKMHRLDGTMDTLSRVCSEIGVPVGTVIENGKYGKVIVQADPFNPLLRKVKHV